MLRCLTRAGQTIPPVDLSAGPGPSPTRRASVGRPRLFRSRAWLRRHAYLPTHVQHVEGDSQTAHTAVPVLVQVEPVERNPRSRRRQTGRVERPREGARPGPVERGLRLPAHQERAVHQFELEIRQRPPGALEELADVAVPSHLPRPRRVVVLDVLGHQLEQAIRLVRVPSGQPTLGELRDEVAIDPVSAGPTGVSDMVPPRGTGPWSTTTLAGRNHRGQASRVLPHNGGRRVAGAVVTTSFRGGPQAGRRMRTLVDTTRSASIPHSTSSGIRLGS
jgi:hypothetical protein